jgi:hypothetical protein
MEHRNNSPEDSRFRPATSGRECLGGQCVKGLAVDYKGNGNVDGAQAVAQSLCELGMRYLAEVVNQLTRRAAGPTS